MATRALTLLALAALGAVVAVQSRFGDRSADAPRLMSAVRDCDFGLVSQGQVLRATFPVANRGTRRLVLDPLNETCCGEEHRPAWIVPPATSVDIRVELDTAQGLGNVSHTVEYATNDPSEPRLTLTVKARVE